MLKLSFFILISFGLTSQASAQSVLSDLVTDYTEKFYDSPQVQSLAKSILRYQYRAQGEIQQSPFVFTSSLSQTRYKKWGMASPPTHRENALVFENTLSANMNSSFTATIGANKYKDEYQSGTLSNTLDNPDEPYTIYSKFSYDLMRGGDTGLNQSFVDLAARQQNILKISSIQEYVTLNYTIRSLITDAFLNECKIKMLGEFKEAISEVVHKGKVQLNTNTISYKDYLNFINLENSFLQRLTNLEFQKQILRQQILSFSKDETLVVGTELELQRCQKILQESDLFVIGYKQQEEVVADGLIMQTLDYKISALSRDAAMSDLRINELSRMPSVSPFIKFEQQKYSLVEPDDKSAMLGVAVSWDVPWNRDKNFVKSSQLSLAQSQKNIQARMLTVKSSFYRLQASLNTQKTVVNILARSLKNTDELIRVLEASKRIGKVDSLNFTNVALNRFDIINSLFDSVGNLEKLNSEYRSIFEWQNFTKIKFSQTNE